MGLTECIDCGHVQSTHPKFGFCDECGSTKLRAASESVHEFTG